MWDTLFVCGTKNNMESRDFFYPPYQEDQQHHPHTRQEDLCTLMVFVRVVLYGNGMDTELHLCRKDDQHMVVHSHSPTHVMNKFFDKC